MADRVHAEAGVRDAAAPGGGCARDLGVGFAEEGIGGSDIGLDVMGTFYAGESEAAFVAAAETLGELQKISGLSGVVMGYTPN